MELAKLAQPFPYNELDWRAQSSGISANGTPWLRAMPYVDSAAIQRRLDDVFGPMGWYTKVQRVDGGVLVTIGVNFLAKVEGSDPERFEARAVERTDGSPIANKADSDGSSADPFRTALSQAFKRAAAQWGIGRELKGYGAQFVEILPDGQRGRYTSDVKSRNGDKLRVSWNPPALPGLRTAGPAPAKPTSAPLIPHSYAERVELLLDLMAFGADLGWPKKYNVPPDRLRGAIQSELVNKWLAERITTIRAAEQDALRSFDAWQKSRGGAK